MYEIFTGRYGYDIEFKCKNKKEVLQVIDQLAKDFEKELPLMSKKEAAGCILNAILERM